MITSRVARAAAVAGLLAVLGGCAGQANGGTDDPSTGPSALPDDPDALVLQVAWTGGYVPPEINVSRLPIVSVYADGRVITEGPMMAIYPGPAWPNVLVQRIEPARVQELVEHAIDAGVTEDDDLGMPPVADLPNTRFTVVSDGEIFTREVYALIEAPPGGGLTEEQEAARAELRDLYDELTAVAGTAGESYVPEAVAAVVRPWIAPDDGLDNHPEVAWPGPALPGDPVGAELTCVTATGTEADAVREAAADATSVTPWVGSDGTRWALVLRPLLPHEAGCADLTS